MKNSVDTLRNHRKGILPSRNARNARNALWVISIGSRIIGILRAVTWGAQSKLAKEENDENPLKPLAFWVPDVWAQFLHSVKQQFTYQLRAIFFRASRDTPNFDRYIGAVPRSAEQTQCVTLLTARPTERFARAGFIPEVCCDRLQPYPNPNVFQLLQRHQCVVGNMMMAHPFPLQNSDCGHAGLDHDLDLPAWLTPRRIMW